MYHNCVTAHRDCYYGRSHKQVLQPSRCFQYDIPPFLVPSCKLLLAHWLHLIHQDGSLNHRLAQPVPTLGPQIRTSLEIIFL